MTFTKDIEEQEAIVRQLRTRQEREWKRLVMMNDRYDCVSARLLQEEARLNEMRNS